MYHVKIVHKLTNVYTFLYVLSVHYTEWSVNVNLCSPASACMGVCMSQMHACVYARESVWHVHKHTLNLLDPMLTGKILWPSPFAHEIILHTITHEIYKSSGNWCSRYFSVVDVPQSELDGPKYFISTQWDGDLAGLVSMNTQWLLLVVLYHL